MTDLLTEQHLDVGGPGAVSGPLRFPDPCIIWLQCQQDGKYFNTEIGFANDFELMQRIKSCVFVPHL